MTFDRPQNHSITGDVTEWLRIFRSVDLLEIGQRPRFVEERLGRTVEAEVGEPTLARNGLHPIRLFALRRLWAEVDVHRTIGVLHNVLLAGGDVRASLFGDGHLPRVLVIGGDRPELLGRRVWRDMQPVSVATGEPIAVAILVSRDVSLSDAGRLGQHPLRDGDSFIEPGGAFIELVVAWQALVHRYNKRMLPVGAGPERRLHALVGGVRLGHRFAYGHCLF